MGFFSLLQYALFLLIVTVLVKPVGGYLSLVFSGERTLLDPALRPLERLIYKLARVDPDEEMDWKRYAVSFVCSGLAGTLLLYAILRLQYVLPWFFAEYHTTPLTADLVMNTAVSFSTTTIWQAYAGESTMSYFSQMVGLTAQGFLAGAAGLAVGMAFIRGLARDNSKGLGNFWVDLVRASLWVLLPVSIVGSLLLIWQGVPMNFNRYVNAVTLEGGSQVIAQGPVAGLELIKNLGTNGGGFFNANGAHPYANPTPLTNSLGMLAIVVLPAALTNTFGRMIGRPRQGWLLFWVMAFLFTVGLLFNGWAEQRGNPRIAGEPNVTMQSDRAQAGGNMEGKEVRFGISQSVLTAVTTSNTSTGSYNSMHDSYTPAGGMVPLVNMLLGEIIFGGLGGGIYSMIMIALVGLFLAGIMIGRSPEYLGKLIGASEIKLITLYTLAGPVILMVLTAVAVVTEPGLAGLTVNGGPHGFTEIFYAYASSFCNNGQSFAGLSANAAFYNVTTAIAMMIGRFGLAIPALALAGLFAAQRRRPMTLGTLPTDTFSFGVLLVGTAVIVGGLSYFAALALGPIVEHLMMNG
ncbi:MAG TPA: potassium-transporting ATPase subunit KdpA [Blastocatellia bacterium]|nr:potassium-transporting ATPase subunit KdpA [Blastocatellia bacterium]